MGFSHTWATGFHGPPTIPTADSPQHPPPPLKKTKWESVAALVKGSQCLQSDQHRFVTEKRSTKMWDMICGGLRRVVEIFLTPDFPTLGPDSHLLFTEFFSRHDQGILGSLNSRPFGLSWWYQYTRSQHTALMASSQAGLRCNPTGLCICVFVGHILRPRGTESRIMSKTQPPFSNSTIKPAHHPLSPAISTWMEGSLHRLFDHMHA